MTFDVSAMHLKNAGQDAPGLTPETFQTLLDMAPAAMMVHDLESLRVLYANRAALTLHQASSFDELDKQYRPGALHLAPPFRFADLQAHFQRVIQAGPQSFQWRAYQDDGVGRGFQVALDPLSIDGRECIVVTLEEEGKRGCAQQATVRNDETPSAVERLNERLALEKLVGQISIRLLTHENEGTDKAIDDVLAMLGDYLHADRCYLFQLDTGRESVSNTHEWCSRGTFSQMPDLQAVPVTIQSGWLETLQRDHRVVVDELDNSSLTPELAEIMAEGNIKSILLVPIFQQGAFSGFLGFDAVHAKRHWPEENIAMVQVVATLVSNTLMRSALLEALTYEANHDSLTGLWNRRYLEAHISQNIAHEERYGGLFSIVIFDIDHFKRVNDHYGHAMGDAVLKTLAVRVSGLIRASDILARWGGEEFLLLLPETNREGAAHLAESLRIQVEAGATQVPLTISLGVATMVAGDTPSSLLKRADAALYQAKAKGRNRVAALE